MMLYQTPSWSLPMGILFTLTSFSSGRADESQDLATLLARPILESDIPLAELRKFIDPRISPMPQPETLEEWLPMAQRIRQEMFEQVIFRGQAAQWRQADTQVQWLETIAGGPGYTLRKLRYEALPGLWIPAILYMPKQLQGRVPVVMNVNGHDAKGKWAEYKQIRCINLVKRGMIVLNPEWLGMGQLASPSFLHYRMNQIDLCGSSGLAPFYLSMKRGLDLLLSLEHADHNRVAVAGLSGGGWQTLFISALDTRVTLSNPVAGYSCFLTRLYEPKDMGDSEQTPCDMATVADYTHLTALRAPRPTLLTNNANDNCCFAASGTLPRLLQSARPVFKLYHKQSHLRTHVNYIPGTHNFELDNRLQLYRMLGEHFYAGSADYPYEEFPSRNEIKTKKEFDVELPKTNANFNSLATGLSQDLPHDPELPKSQSEIENWQSCKRKTLWGIIKANQCFVKATQSGQANLKETQVTHWQLKVGGDWSVPAVELTRGRPTSTVILFSEQGRSHASSIVQELLTQGHRVLAIDPFYFGESQIPVRDFLFGLLVSCVGERPLGIQVTQITAISRWAKEQFGDSPQLRTEGPRASLIGLIAAAIETQAIGALHMQGSFGSLKEIIEQNRSVQEAPELFCFGLLKHFDILQIAGLVAPRPLRFDQASARVQQELNMLNNFYRILKVPEERLPLRSP